MSNLKRNSSKKSDYIDEAWDNEWWVKMAKNLAGMALGGIGMGLMVLFLLILYSR